MRNSSRAITATPSGMTPRNHVFRRQKLLQLTIPAILVNANEVCPITSKKQNLTAIVTAYRSYCLEAITVGRQIEATDFAEVVALGLSRKLSFIQKRLQRSTLARHLK